MFVLRLHLDETIKPEHILLNALGGRKTTKTANCSNLNNKFGGTIDDVMSSQVVAIRNMLQLECWTGAPAPALRSVQAGHLRFKIRGDGSHELSLNLSSLKKQRMGNGTFKSRQDQKPI